MADKLASRSSGWLPITFHLSRDSREKGEMVDPLARERQIQTTFVNVFSVHKR